MSSKELYREVSWTQFKELVIWIQSTGFFKVMYEVRDNYEDRTQMAWIPFPFSARNVFASCLMLIIAVLLRHMYLANA